MRVFNLVAAIVCSAGGLALMFTPQMPSVIRFLGIALELILASANFYLAFV